jgi:hypothetical protein
VCVCVVVVLHTLGLGGESCEAMLSRGENKFIEWGWGEEIGSGDFFLSTSFFL